MRLFCIPCACSARAPSLPSTNTQSHATHHTPVVCLDDPLREAEYRLQLGVSVRTHPATIASSVFGHSRRVALLEQALRSVPSASRQPATAAASAVKVRSEPNARFTCVTWLARRPTISTHNSHRPVILRCRGSRSMLCRTGEERPPHTRTLRGHTGPNVTRDAIRYNAAPARARSARTRVHDTSASNGKQPPTSRTKGGGSPPPPQGCQRGARDGHPIL